MNREGRRSVLGVTGAAPSSASTGSLRSSWERLTGATQLEKSGLTLK